MNMSPYTDLAQRLDRLEQTVLQGLKTVEEKIEHGQDTFRFFRAGLQAHADRVLHRRQVSEKTLFLAGWQERIRHDRELGFPHRKILECLLDQWDVTTGAFRELHFSRLVKLAAVGKNAAGGYLQVLLDKGYVERRTDGYRIFFRIKG